MSSVLLQPLPSRGARPKHAGQLDRQRRLPLRAIDPVSGGLAVAQPRAVDMASEWARASRVVARQPVPGFRADFVRRPRLIERLREARSAALVLLTAPAGYGKTTLLAEWAAEDERPFVWVRLIDADNDPALFVASVIEALDERAGNVRGRARDPSRAGSAGSRSFDDDLLPPGARRPRPTAPLRPRSRRRPSTNGPGVPRGAGGDRRSTAQRGPGGPRFANRAPSDSATEGHIVGWSSCNCEIWP